MMTLGSYRAEVTNERRKTYENAAKPSMTARETIRFDRFTLDVSRGCLLIDAGEVWLRPKSFAVLRYLAENPGRLVSKDELFRTLWTQTSVTDDSLVQCVSDIRQAMGRDAAILIRTVPRRGYMLDVSIAQPDDTRPVAAQEPPAVRPGAFEHRLSIGVRPFRNVGGDPAHDRIAEALTENLITDLSSIRDSMVVTPNAVIAFHDNSATIQTIARELDVRYVFTGSIQGAGPRVRLNCHLIDARGGTNLWATRFEHDGSDIWDWQGKVTREIARTLKFGLVEFASRRGGAERPGNPDAVDLTMRGIVLFSRFAAPAEVVTARGLFEAALRHDPYSVAALVGFAGTHILEMFLLWANDRAVQLEQAEAAITRAVRIDPQSAEVRYTRGNILLLRGEPEQAIAEYRAAIELNPNFSHAHARVGQCKVEMGRPAEAFEPVRDAMRLDPPQLRASLCRFYLGIASFHLGEDDRALQWFEEALATDLRTAQPRMWLAAIHALDGRQTRAEADLAEFNRVHPGHTVASLRMNHPSRVPAYLARQERLYAGLTRAGLAPGQYVG